MKADKNTLRTLAAALSSLYEAETTKGMGKPWGLADHRLNTHFALKTRAADRDFTYNIPACARTAHDGLPQEKNWKGNSAESFLVSPDNSVGHGSEVNWTEHCLSAITLLTGINRCWTCPWYLACNCGRIWKVTVYSVFDSVLLTHKLDGKKGLWQSLQWHSCRVARFALKTDTHYYSC